MGENQEVEFLHKMASSMASADPLQEVLTHIVDFAASVVSCDSCFLYALEDGELTHISILNFTYKPLDARFHLCLYRFECDEDGLEVETQWVRARTSHFSYRSTVR